MEFDIGEVNSLVLHGDNFSWPWKCYSTFTKSMFTWFENGYQVECLRLLIVLNNSTLFIHESSRKMV